MDGLKINETCGGDIKIRKKSFQINFPQGSKKYCFYDSEHSASLAGFFA